MVSPDAVAAASHRTRIRWDRNARGYDRMMVLGEKLIGRRLRPRLWQRVGLGKLLEVGVGTGANFRYYPQGVAATAIDLSGEMLRRAQQKAAGLGLSVDFHQMDAQSLSFAQGSFDQVVTTWVFCSVPDPVQGLSEIKRVLRPGGRLMMLEHVRGPGLLGRIMDWLNPLMVRLSGTSINRDTVANVKRAGLAVEEVKTYLCGVIKLIVARGPEAG